MDFDKQHDRNIAKYERQIGAIYNEAVDEAASLGIGVPNFDPSKPFYFANYPGVKTRVDKLLENLYQNIYSTILNGIDIEWTLANNKNNELAKVVFGDNLNKLPKKFENKYFNNNHDAKLQFKNEKVNGLNISERVWNYTGQFKEEVEMGLDLGIRNGKSAAEMARDMKQYLKQPTKLFRRVRDIHGNLHLSQRAKSYHPGRGVYRSSYKNALRLTGETNNRAYRLADHERRMQADYVVGIEVVLSNNHTLNGVPFTDMCDDLKGKYPKEFVFPGWHVKCRCHTKSLLKTDAEMDRDDELIMEGKEPLGESVNMVKETPKNFNEYIAKNEKKIAEAKSLPFFVKDNYKASNISGGFNLNIINPVIQEPIIETKSFADTKFKDVDDAKLNSKEWISSLTEPEKKAIFEYTKEKYRVINWKLRGVKDITTEADIEIMNNLEKILTNSPKIQTTSYRGMTLDDKIFEQYSNLKKGDIYSDKGFMSTSASQYVADSFAEDANNLIHFTIEGKSGTYINQLSDNKIEAEILFNKESVFKISNIKLKKGKFVNELFINMKEI